MEAEGGCWMERVAWAEDRNLGPGQRPALAAGTSLTTLQQLPFCPTSEHTHPSGWPGGCSGARAVPCCEA